MTNKIREYLDYEGKKLEKGFYKSHLIGFETFYYFAGNYNEKELPLFEKECDNNNLLPFSKDSIKKLIKINKKEINHLKSKVNWLEKKLNKK